MELESTSLDRSEDPYRTRSRYTATLTPEFASHTNHEPIPTELYEYAPLQKPSENIRLLYLLPASCSTGDENQTIVRSELRTSRLKDAPPYTALSYTWGESTFGRKMIVNGKLLSITPNLAVALEHLQEQHKTLIIYVDRFASTKKTLRRRAYRCN